MGQRRRCDHWRYRCCSAGRRGAAWGGAGLNILVATPGRLLQHMDETPGFDAGGLRVLVLDEADRIMDMVWPPLAPRTVCARSKRSWLEARLHAAPIPGARAWRGAARRAVQGFRATMDAVLKNLPRERQTLLFSATQTKSVRVIAP